MTEFQVHSTGLSGKRKKHRKLLAQLRHWVRQTGLNRLRRRKLTQHLQPFRFRLQRVQTC